MSKFPTLRCSDVLCSDPDRIFRFQEGGGRRVLSATFLIYQAFSCICHWVSSASLNTRFLFSCYGFCNLLILYMIGSLVLCKTPQDWRTFVLISSAYSSSTSSAWLNLFRHSSRTPCQKQALRPPERYQQKGGKITLTKFLSNFASFPLYVFLKIFSYFKIFF